jgi:hypothetical protein
LLVRHHHIQAAQIWRREFADQTRPQADLFLERLAELQQQYAMRMPTVADRLGERFVRPMVIDRIRALVRPAIEERQQSGPGRSFELLQEETDALTREPTGVGLDVPAWLMALEEEVASVLGDHPEREPTRELEDAIPQQPLTLADARRQLERWSTEMERK